MLGAAFLGVGTIERWVRQPRITTNPLAIIAPILWWEARMVEGYTIEAACAMLTALADPARLADIEALLSEVFECDGTDHRPIC